MRTQDEILKMLQDEMAVPPEAWPKIEEFLHDVNEWVDLLKSRSLLGMAANLHFCRLVGKLHGVNEDEGPDYPAMAKEARELAELTTPFLLAELGIESQEEVT